MQQRRLRPGDVLDDYCPRERRITDHAIVAMIDDEIKQTRCVSCDTEHEYKQAKVPPQRRKKAPAALFTQVLEGLQGPARIAHNAGTADPSVGDLDIEPPSETGMPSHTGTPSDVELPRSPVNATDEASEADTTEVPSPSRAASKKPAPPTEPEPGAEREPEPAQGAEDGPVRRPLIRAQLPRHEGQPPPTRDLPDFTIRQPSSGRGNRPTGHGGGSRPGSGRRRPGGPQQGGGAMRFGSESRSKPFGRANERRHGGRQGQGPGQGHGHGQGGHGQGQGPGRPNRGGRRGGGGKKP